MGKQIFFLVFDQILDFYGPDQIRPHQMSQNESKWLQMAPNGSKWLQMVPMGSTWLWLRQMDMAMAQHCPKWS